jgi:hypothetical protein
MMTPVEEGLQYMTVSVMKYFYNLLHAPSFWNGLLLRVILQREVLFLKLTMKETFSLSKHHTGNC